LSPGQFGRRRPNLFAFAAVYFFQPVTIVGKAGSLR